jgi:V/A-type H+-transporting ATPase subunit D
MFEKPAWFPDGVAILEKLVKLAIEKEVFERKMELLDFARKKTTQKVNLYEKVQIPGFQDAIRKIKRFLEDEENLSKASQKIVKNRQQNMEVES